MPEVSENCASLPSNVRARECSGSASRVITDFYRTRGLTIEGRRLADDAALELDKTKVKWLGTLLLLFPICWFFASGLTSDPNATIGIAWTRGPVTAHAACPAAEPNFTNASVSARIKPNLQSNTLACSVAGTEGSSSVAAISLVNVFYPDAYGASGSTATIVATTTASSKVIVANDGIADFKINQGVHILAAGPTVAYGGAQLKTPTCVGSPCTGIHSYSWIVITADPLKGMSAASTIVTKSSMPAIDSLGYSQYFKITGTQEHYAPVGLYLVYCSYDGGPYTFVFVDNSIVHPGTADFGQRPPDGRGWPVSLPGGATFAGRRGGLLQLCNSYIRGRRLTLNDVFRLPLSQEPPFCTMILSLPRRPS